MRPGRGFTAVARQVPRLAAGGDPLHPGLRATGAQGRRETCGLAGVLPPWHDRCHGSRQGVTPAPRTVALCVQWRRGTCGLAGILPPWPGGHGSPVWYGDMPVGGGWPLSAQGDEPLDPLIAPTGRGGIEGLAAWPGVYRRGPGGHGSPILCDEMPVGRVRFAPSAVSGTEVLRKNGFAG